MSPSDRPDWRRVRYVACVPEPVVQHYTPPAPIPPPAGFLSGAGYTIPYCLFGLLAGRLVDMYPKTRVLAGGIVLWSVAVGTQALAKSFGALLASRMVLGVGESVSAPASVAILSAVFPPEQLGLATGVYAAGLYIGAGLASMSLLLGQSIGWRETTLLVAFVGLLSALLVVLTDEPNSGAATVSNLGETVGDALAPLPATPSSASPSMARLRPASPLQPPQPPALPLAVEKKQAPPTPVGGDTAALVQPDADLPRCCRRAARGRCRWCCLQVAPAVALLQDRTFLLICAAAGVRFVGGVSIGAYCVKYFAAAFPAHTSQYAYINACIVCFGGAASVLLGGRLSDKLLPRLGRSARASVPAVATVIALACFAGVMYARNFYVGMMFLFFEYLFGESWIGPILALVQELSARRQQVGMATAIVLLCSNLVGAIGPLLLGAVDDTLRNPADIRGPLFAAVASSYAVAALLFAWIAARVRATSLAEPAGADSSPHPPSPGTVLATEHEHLLTGPQQLEAGVYDTGALAP